MELEYRRIAAAVKASAEKRTRDGVRFIPCAACGKQMRRWLSQIRRAKWPMTCGWKCRSLRMSGSGNSLWKGGSWIQARNGYRYIRTADLMLSDMDLIPSPAPRDYPEHRIVMARMLRRPLKSSEMVHHVNGDKSDNRPENLHLMNWSEHSKEHKRVLSRLAELEAENAKLRAALALK